MMLFNFDYRCIFAYFCRQTKIRDDDFQANQRWSKYFEYTI